MNDDPAYRFLFPDPAERKRGLTDFFVRHLRTHLPYRCTFVMLDGPDLLGTVTVRPPGGVPISLLTMVRHGLGPFALRNGRGAVKRLFTLKRVYDELEEKVARGERHWHVHMMAVVPSRQGRGLGTELLAGAFALSAAAPGAPPLPIVLTTHTERNVVFYQRLGFDVANRCDVSPDGGEPYPVWSMRQERVT